MSVWEARGVWASGSKDNKGIWVRIYEVRADCIGLEATYNTAEMTVEEARALARQLYRLARRVEQRRAPVEKT